MNWSAGKKAWSARTLWGQGDQQRNGCVHPCHKNLNSINFFLWDYPEDLQESPFADTSWTEAEHSCGGNGIGRQIINKL